MTRQSIAARIRAHPVAGNPFEMRQAFAALAGPGPTGEPLVLGGVRAVRHGDGPPAMWLHGGGYVFGSPETHAGGAQWLAKKAGMTVLVPEYRLAPDHVWPAQLDDALAVLDAIGAPVGLIGDSAGGHLALAVARRRPERVKRIALISPNTDRSGQSTTRADNSDTDLMNSDEDDQRLARMAMPRLDPLNPDASPLLASLKGLPPTFVTASTREVLLDDSLLLIAALARAGVRVQADIIDDLWHMWTLWPGELSAARRTLGKIAAFLNDPSR